MYVPPALCTLPCANRDDQVELKKKGLAHLKEGSDPTRDLSSKSDGS